VVKAGEQHRHEPERGDQDDDLASPATPQAFPTARRGSGPWRSISNEMQVDSGSRL